MNPSRPPTDPDRHHRLRTQLDELHLRYQGEALTLDTHVARISGLIGLGRRRTPDGKLALEITAAFRELCPEDPLKYDFPMAHLGILGDCPGAKRMPGCARCPLVELCGTWR